jgi:hypothetical protein
MRGVSPLRAARVGRDDGVWGWGKEERATAKLVQSHRSFSEQARKLLTSDGAEQHDQRADAIERRVRELLQLVVIDLSVDENAQEIFETLNARQVGRKLLDGCPALGKACRVRFEHVFSSAQRTCRGCDRSSFGGFWNRLCWLGPGHSGRGAFSTSQKSATSSRTVGDHYLSGAKPSSGRRCEAMSAAVCGAHKLFAAVAGIHSDAFRFSAVR